MLERWSSPGLCRTEGSIRRPPDYVGYLAIDVEPAHPGIRGSDPGKGLVAPTEALEALTQKAHGLETPPPRIRCGCRRGSREPGQRSATTTPPATITAPTTRPHVWAIGASFSKSTKVAIAATHRRFMTPPTNSRAMSTQQHPRQ